MFSSTTAKSASGLLTMAKKPTTSPSLYILVYVESGMYAVVSLLLGPPAFDSL